MSYKSYPIKFPKDFFHIFLIFDLQLSSLALIFDGVRARLRKVASSAFLYKSYYPLVGGTSPIPFNKLIAWLRNSYESLFSSIGVLF